MSNPLEAFFDAGLLQKTAFPPESRYHGIAIKSLAGPDGVPVPYLARRPVPAPERFADLSEHRVKQGERLDRIAATQIGDPTQFWQLCDANGTIKPEELEVPGARIRITLPADVPAPTEGTGS